MTCPTKTLLKTAVEGLYTAEMSNLSPMSSLKARVQWLIPLRNGTDKHNSISDTQQANGIIKLDVRIRALYAMAIVKMVFLPYMVNDHVVTLIF